MINRTNTVLAGLLVAVVIMTGLVDVDYTKPNIEILPDMKYTPAWEAFAANRNFADGRTMQAPVPGTIARGQVRLYYAATKEDAARAGEELENPLSLDSLEATISSEIEAAESVILEPHEAAPSGDPSPDAESTQQKAAASRDVIARERFAASIERGGEVYRTFCISCHGPQGAGDGLVPQRGFPPPPSMLTGKSLQMKDGQLFHILTYGQGSMAPFPAQLSRDRRWDVINYVRDLQRKAPPVPATETSATESSATESSVTESSVTEATPTTDATKQSTKNPEDERPTTPPNTLRGSPADSQKQSEAPDTKVPADESVPNTDAES